MTVSVMDFLLDPFGPWSIYLSNLQCISLIFILEHFIFYVLRCHLKIQLKFNVYSVAHKIVQGLKPTFAQILENLCAKVLKVNVAIFKGIKQRVLWSTLIYSPGLLVGD